ncbi:CopG family transcriptional regulator [Candidatus Manganitrophus noduliformans]|uniref:CopG family transcriptional regulator n=1 Tax=Candidatus Manganitrophus noduliformans TaxID=2606439 RepID=A0A7X6DL69_9BACT|nr:CopG family transcriptional regulator [Candidatus Manganitrophus noduliformans]NKE69212.1 CopG family transcriptional regulator [Candidatus Manganitrophus noduliformans]
MKTKQKKQKRATISFNSELHKALRLKAEETDQSLSDLVNDAVRKSLAEDAEDLAAFEKRAGEPNLLFEDVLKQMKKRGQL